MKQAIKESALVMASLIGAAVVLGMLLSGCTPQAVTKPGPIEIPSLWENMGGDTYRLIDKDYGIVCYTRFVSSQNLSCVKVDLDQ